MKRGVLALTRPPALVLAALLSSSGAVAADREDVQSKAGLRFKLDLPRRWWADLEVQDRMVDDLGTHRGTSVTVGAGYGVTRRITALASYRRTTTSDGDATRYAGGFEVERDLGQLKLGFRPLLQHRTAYVDDDETGGSGTAFLRTRLRAEYPLTKRLDVLLSVEPFFAFGADFPVDNWRDTVALRYAFTKHVGVEASYTYRPDYAKAYNREFHVLGLSLRLDARAGGKKRKPGQEVPHR